MEEIHSLRHELNSVKFDNKVLKEENERINSLYQVTKCNYTQNPAWGSGDAPSPLKKRSSQRLSRNEYNWGTLLKMYETKLKAMKTELEKLKWCTAVPETRL